MVTMAHSSTLMTCRQAIPWYVHPAEDPAAWAALRDLDDLSLAVVNVANGPGEPDDPYYPEALATCGDVPWIGYVNLDYGRRPVHQVLADARAWRDRYGITELFLDCVPGPRDLRRGLVRVLLPLRAETDRLIGNPGQVADPHLVSLFDVTVVVENSWDVYRRMSLPGWHADIDPGRLWHLVHGCPGDKLEVAHRLARARQVGHFFATDRTLPNPWRGFPQSWRDRKD